MMKARLALAFALAGCGRIGFQQAEGRSGDGGPDAVAGDLVRLVVTSDAYLAEMAGRPIAGATVLVERSGGTDRLMTDAMGTAQFPAAGAIACHVVYKREIGWRGYTVTAPPAGMTIELGSRPASNPTHGMTFTLPGNATASSFAVRLPEHCATPSPSGTSDVGITYEAACEGQPVRLLGYALQPASSGNSDLYVDAGTVKLTNGATQAVTGSYQPLPTRSLAVSNLPAATDTVSAELLARSDLDLTSLTPTIPSAAPQGSGAMLSFGAVPGGNTLRVQVFAVTPVQYLASTERIAPVTLSTQAAFDAGSMLPIFESVVASSSRSIRWTGGGAGGTITIIEGISGGLQWDFYLDPSATSVTVPEPPADLGVPMPGPPDVVSIVKLDVPGATAADLLPTIDRRWSLWPHDPLLLPQAGSSATRLLYLAAGPRVAPEASDRR